MPNMLFLVLDKIYQRTPWTAVAAPKGGSSHHVVPFAAQAMKATRARVIGEQATKVALLCFGPPGEKSH
jgi:hypothetical protein